MIYCKSTPGDRSLFLLIIISSFVVFFFIAHCKILYDFFFVTLIRIYNDTRFSTCLNNFIHFLNNFLEVFTLFFVLYDFNGRNLVDPRMLEGSPKMY